MARSLIDSVYFQWAEKGIRAQAIKPVSKAFRVRAL